MYAKIFRQIFDSSIAENHELRHIFMDLLVLADSDGVVDMTPESISRTTNVPLERVIWAIGELEKPDPRSRTSYDHGIRLKRLDDHRNWGWLIVNYDRFRRIASEDSRKAHTRDRVRRYREKTQAVDNQLCNAPVTPCNACNAREIPLHMHIPSESLEGGTGETSNAPSNAGSNAVSSAQGKPSVVLATLKAELEDAYNRRPNRRWPYAEEFLLAEVSRRPEVLEEWKELKIYRKENPKYFPRSIQAVMECWAKTLDHARNAPPTPPEEMTIEEKEVHAANLRAKRLCNQ